MKKASLGTAVTELFGIELPIFGGPMGGVAGPELVAAVSEAGGLGLLGHANLDPAEVRAQIRQTKALTSRPFGIGLLFPSGRSPQSNDDRPPLPGFLEQFIGPEGLAPVPSASYSHELAEKRLAIAIEEGVPVLSLGLGAPAAIVERARSAGMKVIALVGSRKAAVEVASMGVDAIVAQGHEAGGHTGRTSTMVLIPQVVDAVDVPVIAAGGIMDGRGLAAALMLGAQGVLLGTRLLATPEARAHANHKRHIVEMHDDETVVSRCYTGKPSRVIRNAFIDSWAGHDGEIMGMPAQWERVAPVVIPAKRQGLLDVANWPTGQGAVLVEDISPARDVVRRMAAEAAERMEFHRIRENAT
jgi:NAD(P)H-dependent flavin oxidoreductase YrpB (nitropropane dioxygenase family)